METLTSARKIFPPLKARPLPFIAVPIYGNITVGFHQCMMDLLVHRTEFADVCHQQFQGDSLVTRARNELTNDFLRSNCTDLLFIDSDLLFHVDHIKRILSHDLDIVGGCYPIKSEGPTRWVFNSHFGGRNPDEHGLIDVRYIGTGFMRIRRQVLERMIESGLAKPYEPDHRPGTIDYDFWPVGSYTYTEKSGAVVPEVIGKTRYLSEDWWFCQNALDLGMKVFIDGKIILRHIGQATYPLETQVAAMGTSDKEIFRSAETGGADSAKSPPTALPQLSTATEAAPAESRA